MSWMRSFLIEGGSLSLNADMSFKDHRPIPQARGNDFYDL